MNALKLFLTIEMVAMIMLITSAYVDATNRTTTGYSDDGWTWYYTIPRLLRNQTRGLMYFAGLLSFSGIIIFIWTL